MISLFSRIIRPGLLGLSKTDLRNIGRAAIAEAGYSWHRRYKSFHFQIFAFAKYGYRKRTKKYEQRKKREHPEAQGRPLVFSGNSERSAMASNIVRAAATSFDRFQARVSINAPTLNYQRLHDEMTRTTVGEQRQLAEDFRDEFERRLVSTANQKIVPLEMTVRVG